MAWRAAVHPVAPGARADHVFSMNGPDIPEVKKIIRSTTYEHAKTRRAQGDELRQRTTGDALPARRDPKDYPRGLLTDHGFICPSVGSESLVEWSVVR